MNKVLLVMLAGIMALAWTGPSAAQSTREAIIDQARDEIDDPAAIGIYLSALDSELGEPDSLWAVASFDIADRLMLMGQEPLASIWLRWLVRHRPQYTIDRDYYAPILVEEYDGAIESVGDAGGGVAATTGWRWPLEFDETLPGSIEATAGGQTASVAVAVEGEEEAAGEESLSLSPGTYEFVVKAEGFEAARVVREILPGVTTLLDVDLVASLSPQVRAGVAENLVQITYTQAGQEVCRNGLLSGSDGLVLTTLGALEGRASLGVSVFNGREVFTDVPLVTSDPGRDLAVLQLRTGLGAPIPTALSAEDGQTVWSVFYSGCADLTSVRTQLADWPGPQSSLAEVTLPLPSEAVGAPLVDQGGSLLGLITGPTTFVPFGLTEDILDQARQELLPQARPEIPPQIPEEMVDQGSSGGGFPWKWVGAGVGAAGLAFALTQGGGGDGGPGPVTEPTVGTLRITFPSGG